MKGQGNFEGYPAFFIGIAIRCTKNAIDMLTQQLDKANN